MAMRAIPGMGLWICLLAAAPAAAAEPAGDIIDQIVAVVDGKPFTLSELRFEASLALLRRGAVSGIDGELPPGALWGALQYAIAERLAAKEADKLRAFELGAQEAQSALSSLKATLGAETWARFLRFHDVNEQKVAAALLRSLRAQRFIDNAVSLKVAVSEAELSRYYQDHAEELGQPFDQVRERIRDRLMRQRYGQKAAAEIASLRAQADVRILIPAPKEMEP
jgi:hypothetical protein